MKKKNFISRAAVADVLAKHQLVRKCFIFPGRYLVVDGTGEICHHCIICPGGERIYYNKNGFYMQLHSGVGTEVELNTLLSDFLGFNEQGRKMIKQFFPGYKKEEKWDIPELDSEEDEDDVEIYYVREDELNDGTPNMAEQQISQFKTGVIPSSSSRYKNHYKNLTNNCTPVSSELQYDDSDIIP